MKAVKRILEIAPAAGFCLSEAPDQVSQWRGYAQDGRGVSLGFSAAYLESLGQYYIDKQDFGFSLQKVIYDRVSQMAEIEEIVAHCKRCIKEGAFQQNVGLLIFANDSKETADDRQKRVEAAERKLYSQLLMMLFSLFKLKNTCFSDEREWRLLAYISRGSGSENDMLRKCSYRAVARGIVPYLPIKLADLSQRIITEVIIGPINVTPPEHIVAFLVANGIDGVVVRKSEASYR